MAADQIGGPGGAGIGDRGSTGLAADRPGQAELAHEPLDGAAGHRDALPVERQPDLARAVDAVVGGVHPLDMCDEFGIAVLPATRLPRDLLVVGRWGDRHSQPGQLRADRLDTPTQTIGALAAALMLGDEPCD